MSARRGNARIWTAPLIIGGASGVGLLSALLSDSVGDWIAWFTLATPIVVIAWFTRPHGGNTRR